MIPKDFYGVVAKCQMGKLGVVYKVSIPIDKKEPCVYYGISLDGSAWESKDPIFVAENIELYIRRTIIDTAANIEVN